MLVILSGAEQAAQPVQRALEQIGATVIRADLAAGVGGGADGQKADAYVQLPTLLSVESQAVPDSLVERVGRFLADGLLTRFRSAAAVLPHLAERASVVIVAGNTPVPGTGVDDQAARGSLLRVLAHALRAEEAPRRLRVRVLGPDSTPEMIARCAAGEDFLQSSASGPPAGNNDVDMS